MASGERGRASHAHAPTRSLNGWRYVPWNGVAHRSQFVNAMKCSELSRLKRTSPQPLELISARVIDQEGYCTVRRKTPRLDCGRNSLASIESLKVAVPWHQSLDAEGAANEVEPLKLASLCCDIQTEHDLHSEESPGEPLTNRLIIRERSSGIALVLATAARPPKARPGRASSAARSTMLARAPLVTREDCPSVGRALAEGEAAAAYAVCTSARGHGGQTTRASRTPARTGPA